MLVSSVSQRCRYALYMTVYFVISLPKVPYIHRIYIFLAWPTLFVSKHQKHSITSDKLDLARGTEISSSSTKKGKYTASTGHTHLCVSVLALISFQHGCKGVVQSPTWASRQGCERVCVRMYLCIGGWLREDMRV